MSGKRARRQFLAERKAEVVRRHLAGKEAVSDLADGCVLRLPAAMAAARIAELVHALERRGAR